MRRSALHRDDHRAIHDRVREITDAGERNGAEDGEPTDLVSWSYAPQCGCTASMSSVEQAAQPFLVLGLRAEVGVCLVDQQRHRMGRDQPEQHRRAHVEGVFRCRAQERQHLEVARLPDPFSGEITASRGVLSKQSTAWLWTTYRATASREAGEG